MNKSSFFKKERKYLSIAGGKYSNKGRNPPVVATLSNDYDIECTEYLNISSEKRNIQKKKENFKKGGNHVVDTLSKDIENIVRKYYISFY